MLLRDPWLLVPLKPAWDVQGNSKMSSSRPSKKLGRADTNYNRNNNSRFVVAQPLLLLLLLLLLCRRSTRNEDSSSHCLAPIRIR